MDLFNSYKSVNIFTLYDAGYLLCEEKPLEPVPGTREDVHLEERRRRASIVTFQLMSDAQAGKLKTENIDHKYGSSHFELIETKWIVMRHDLEEWAKAKGIKPSFLFQEETPLDEIKEQTLKKESPRKIGNLCRVVACLAIDGYGYDPEGAKSPIPKELAEMMSKKFEVSFSEKTIRDWIKEGLDTIETKPHKS